MNRTALRAWRWAGGIAGLLSLGACVVGPAYAPPASEAPASYQESGSTLDVAFSSARQSLSQWWLLLGDPTLDGLIHDALQDNPDLQVAASRVREARQQVREAAAAELPTVSGAGSAIGVNSNRASGGASTASAAAAAGGSAGQAGAAETLSLPGHLNLYSLGFDATWELDLFGGVRRGVEQARASAEANEWRRRDGQVSLVAELVNDYFALRAAQTRIRIGVAELERQRQLFALIRDRRLAGFVTNLDVNQQSVEVETAAAQLPQLRAMEAAQRHAIAVLIAKPPEDLQEKLQPTGQPLPGPPAVLGLGLPSDLLRRRPDVREAERRLAAANAGIGVQVAKLYPSVDLVGFGSFASTEAANLLSSQNLQSIILGSVTQPLFNGGRTRAAIAAAREEKTQAFLTYRKTVLAAFQDVEDALARFKAEDERRASLDRLTQASQNSLLIAEAQYTAGLTPFLSVLQAENTVLNSRDQLAQSDAQRLSDLASLFKALGGGYDAAAAEHASAAGASRTLNR